MAAHCGIDDVKAEICNVLLVVALCRSVVYTTAGKDVVEGFV